MVASPIWPKEGLVLGTSNRPSARPATLSRPLLLFIVLALVAAACSSGETAPPSTDAGGTTAAPADTASAPAGDDQEGKSSAEIAVEEAQQYSGTTLDVMWSGGLQAVEIEEFTGPLWEELTGIKINVIPTNTPDQLANAITDHAAGTGSFDVLHAPAAVLVDLVQSGAAENLDPFVAKYMNPADLEDFHPLYAGLGDIDGSKFALFDDGDVIFMYYRTDVFEDAELQAAFKSEHGRDLAVPTTWEDLNTVAQFITDQRAPEMYGFGINRDSPNRLFNPQFQVNGGEFFDVENDMRALINSPAGVLTATQMREQNAAAPPGTESMSSGDSLALWLNGDVAMTFFWPPLGRWSAGIGSDDERLNFVPASTVKDVTGFALLPGDVSVHAGGFQLSVSADSDAKEAAYLFLQWVTSPEISLQRQMQPTSLRDAYRLSHFESSEYGNWFPGADRYVEAVGEAVDHAVLELSIPSGIEYGQALDQALADIFAGADPQTALDTAAAEWDRITDRIGVDVAREGWERFLTFPGATLDTTVAAQGLN